MGTVTVTVTDQASHTATASVGYTVGASATSTLAGVSDSNIPAGPLDTADVVGLYRFGAVDSAVSRRHPKWVSLSDEGGVTTIAQLDAALASYTRNHPTLPVDYCIHNEATAEDPSTSELAAFIQFHKDARALMDAKYPLARLGFDATQYGIKVGRHVKYQPLAQYLHVFLASCYNPGRDKSPIVWDDVSYLDDIVQVAADWGIKHFGCKEFGNPVDPRDPKARAAYSVKARQRIHSVCAALGITHDYDIWWNNQKAGGPNNRLDTEPDFATALAWKTAPLS